MAFFSLDKTIVSGDGWIACRRARACVCGGYPGQAGRRRRTHAWLDNRRADLPSRVHACFVGTSSARARYERLATGVVLGAVPTRSGETYLVAAGRSARVRLLSRGGRSSFNVGTRAVHCLLAWERGAYAQLVLPVERTSSVTYMRTLQDYYLFLEADYFFLERERHTITYFLGFATGLLIFPKC